MASFFVKLFQVLRDFDQLFFLRKCVVCGGKLQPNEDIICTHCLTTLPYSQFKGMAGYRIERLFYSDIPIECANSLLFYQRGAHDTRLIHSMKYDHNKKACVYMGRVMAQDLVNTNFFDGIDAIVPIPLHKNRRRHRGYNQSELLARGVAEVTHLPVWTEVVARIIDNKTLTQMDFYERRAQTEGIFECIRPEQIRGKHLLMVDDVVTSGATLSSCMKCMSGLGVRFSVLTLAAARAPIDFPGFVHYDFDV